jgi:pimeloyl-ACP methyl ester carboxylesterase
MLRLTLAGLALVLAACGAKKDKDESGDEGAEGSVGQQPMQGAGGAGQHANVTDGTLIVEERCHFLLELLGYGDDPAAAEQLDFDGVFCGSLPVLENRADPASRVISIHFEVVYPDAGPSTLNPIVIHYGGPGDTGVGIMASARKVANATGRDVVAIGQRGTYFSNYLHYADPSCATPLERTAACEAELGGRYDTAAYTSRESAADWVEIVRALRHEAMVVYGVSYGSFLFARLMADYPERVEAAVLDSVLPFDGLETKQQTELLATHGEIVALLEEAFATTCAADANAVYTGLCPRLDPEQISGEPLWADSAAMLADYDAVMATKELDSQDRLILFSMLRTLAMYRMELKELALMLVAGYARDDYDTRYARTEDFLQFFYGKSFTLDLVLGSTSATNDDARFTPVMYDVVACNEREQFADDDLTSASFDDDPVLTAAPRDLIASYNHDSCHASRKLLDASLPEVYGALPQGIETLIVNGLHDAATPVAWARRTAEQIDGSILAEVPCSGHGVLAQLEREGDVIARFLAGAIVDGEALADEICDGVATQIEYELRPSYPVRRRVGGF